MDSRNEDPDIEIESSINQETTTGNYIFELFYRIL